MKRIYSEALMKCVNFLFEKLVHYVHRRGNGSVTIHVLTCSKLNLEHQFLTQLYELFCSSESEDTLPVFNNSAHQVWKLKFL